MWVRGSALGDWNWRQQTDRLLLNRLEMTGTKTTAHVRNWQQWEMDIKVQKSHDMICFFCPHKDVSFHSLPCLYFSSF